MGIKNTEVQFLVHLATVDVRRHLSALQTLASSKFGTLPFDEIGYSVDYCSTPVRLDVFKIADDRAPSGASNSAEVLLKLSRQESASQRRLLKIVYYARKRTMGLYQLSTVGVKVAIPSLRPGTVVGGEKRMSGLGPDQHVLVADYDEIDEAIHRLKFSEGASRRASADATHLWEQVSEQTWAKDDAWPFQ